jgi:hypothetical protein
LSCLKGNFHEPFLGGLAGAIPPGYPADEETGRKVRRLILTQLEGGKSCSVSHAYDRQ